MRPGRCRWNCHGASRQPPGKGCPNAAVAVVQPTHRGQADRHGAHAEADEATSGCRGVAVAPHQQVDDGDRDNDDPDSLQYGHGKQHGQMVEQGDPVQAEQGDGEEQAQRDGADQVGDFSVQRPLQRISGVGQHDTGYRDTDALPSGYRLPRVPFGRRPKR